MKSKIDTDTHTYARACAHTHTHTQLLHTDSARGNRSSSRRTGLAPGRVCYTLCMHSFSQCIQSNLSTPKQFSNTLSGWGVFASRRALLHTPPTPSLTPEHTKNSQFGTVCHRRVRQGGARATGSRTGGDRWELDLVSKRATRYLF